MRPALLLLLLLALLGGCRPAPSGPASYTWELPAGFPMPRVPADNPMSEAKVQLGRALFHDVRLSRSQTQSCASCHVQALGFTDGKGRAEGSTGEAHRRNAQGLANVTYATSLTWANPALGTLEVQALAPLFGTAPVELGFGDRQEELLERLASVPELALAFADAFPDKPQPVSVASLTRALGSFQRTLLSGGSAYDRYVYRGDESALTASAARGMELFFSERLECDHCHAGFNFQDAVAHEATPEPLFPFHNTGLYDLDGHGAFPAEDQGLTELTGRPEDMGRMRAPSLRNVGVTGPYMHDGSIATLTDVIDHYAQGGRSRLANDGKASPLRSPFVRGFTLSAEERVDLLAFLDSLTDHAFLDDARHADPAAP